MNKDKVRRCDACGFLALRRIGDRQILEADEDYRIRADIPRDIVTFEIICDFFPVCFIAKRDLTEEIIKQGDPINSNGLLAVIQQESLCDGFVAWVRGFTPKEHTEMLDREKWREWQKAERKWHFAELLILFAMSLVFLFVGLFISN